MFLALVDIAKQFSKVGVKIYILRKIKKKTARDITLSILLKNISVGYFPLRKT